MTTSISRPAELFLSMLTEQAHPERHGLDGPLLVVK